MQPAKATQPGRSPRRSSTTTVMTTEFMDGMFAVDPRPPAWLESYEKAASDPIVKGFGEYGQAGDADAGHPADGQRVRRPRPGASTRSPPASDPDRPSDAGRGVDQQENEALGYRLTHREHPKRHARVLRHGCPGAGGRRLPLSGRAGKPADQGRPRRAVDALLIIVAGEVPRGRLVAGRRLLRRRAGRGQLRRTSRGGRCRSSTCCPGLLFLVVFQLYTMFFTGYASFTNYGTGHLDDKDAAIDGDPAQNVVPVEGAPSTRSSRSSRDGTVSMLITDPEPARSRIGTNDGLDAVADGDVQRDGDKVTGVAGYESLNLGDADRNRTTPPSGRRCSRRSTRRRASTCAPSRSPRPPRRSPAIVYDEDQDAMVSTPPATVYPAERARSATSSRADGPALQPGLAGRRRVRQLRRSCSPTTRCASRFLPILMWTFVFAIVTTLLNFALGLALALVLRERRMRGQGIYRLLLIIPFGLPFDPDGAGVEGHAEHRLRPGQPDPRHQHRRG